MLEVPEAKRQKLNPVSFGIAFSSDKSNDTASFSEEADCLDFLESFNHHLKRTVEDRIQNAVLQIKNIIQTRNPITKNRNLMKGCLSVREKNINFEILCEIANQLIFKTPLIVLKMRNVDYVMSIFWENSRDTNDFCGQKCHSDKVLLNLKTEGFPISFTIKQLYNPKPYFDIILKNVEFYKVLNEEFNFASETDSRQFKAITSYIEKTLSYVPFK